MKSVLLYDGECGFCNAIVTWILRHEGQRQRKSSLYFAALHSPLAATLLLQQPQLHQTNSVLWVEVDDAQMPQEILCRSAAALRVGAYLGGWWNLLRLASVIPRPLRDRVYDVVARNRHRLLRGASCEIASEGSRRRFLATAEDLVS